MHYTRLAVINAWLFSPGPLVPIKEAFLMKIVVWILVVLLVILHQDNWYWNDTRLVFGFMPIALLYHACLSVAAAITWYLATVLVWPRELEHEVTEDREGVAQP